MSILVAPRLIWADLYTSVMVGIPKCLTEIASA